MMHKILSLWAVPRSTSTAFEWMMRQRGDFVCFHEPLGEAWYQGEEPLWPRVGPDSVRTPGLTIDSVISKLCEVAVSDPVFIKDFALYVDDRFDEGFLSLFRHSFLIRDPAKTITSMYDKWPDFHEKEAGFCELRQLFDLLTDRHGEPPPLIDSDDLLEDPHAVVRLWCEAVGIPFLPDALRWEPGARDEVSWWDGGSFHASLRDSDGLKPQRRSSSYIDIAEVPARVREVHARALPHYEHLYQHRLRPPGRETTNSQRAN